jgi:hypothetical protein
MLWSFSHAPFLRYVCRRLDANGPSVQDISTLKTMESFNEFHYERLASKNCSVPGGSIHTCDVLMLQSSVNVGLKYCRDISEHFASICNVNYVAADDSGRAV